MNFPSVLLIFRREFRDQIRDRRTLFTIVVLPIFLYPMLGMLFLQITQFMQQHPTRIRIIGAAHLPDDPQLLDGDKFAVGILPSNISDSIDLNVLDPSLETDSKRLQERVQDEINRGEVDAVVFIPSTFSSQLADFRSELKRRHTERLVSSDGEKPSELAQAMPELPQPTILYNAARDHSIVARDRVQRALDGWRSMLVAENLAQSKVPVVATRPFEVANTDVAPPVRRRAAMWSKVLPFVVLIWALTGAFYPAIDLCAGEKERGTLETLLSGPALRSEIVWGKLLTVMTFSVATAALNMASLGLTAMLFMRQFSAAGMSSLAPPSLSTICWLLLAIIPCAALFSALALAIASFAKSSKEGQYYLLPLLMFSLPLMMLSLMPAARLSLGTSLIPLTGLMLLVRVAIEGRILEALPLIPFVGLVTTGSCVLAIRWAISQFQNEDVLFRESERISLLGSLKNLWRDRKATPALSHAVFGGFLLLGIRFVASTFATVPTTWGGFAGSLIVTQLAFIAAPALALTFFLTRNRLRTLSLDKRPVWWTIPAAALAAACLHPAAIWLHHGIAQVYPLNPAAMEQLLPIQMLLQNAPLIQVLLVIALIPAVCEELAFRGFLLSGFRRGAGEVPAILFASLFFGVAHGMIQQSIFATLVGIVIGFVALRSGSLWPAIAFHFTNNALVVSTSRISPHAVIESPIGRLFYKVEETEAGLSMTPQWYVMVIGVLIAGIILGRLCRRSTGRKGDTVLTSTDMATANA
jgi:sodium transport system permease protein